MRAPCGWAGLAQIALPQMAPEAVRERIRKRWERRRAETDGETVACARWFFEGRYTYPMGYYCAVYDDVLPSLTRSQRATVLIEKVAP